MIALARLYIVRRIFSQINQLPNALQKVSFEVYLDYHQSAIAAALPALVQYSSFFSHGKRRLSIQQSSLSMAFV